MDSETEPRPQTSPGGWWTAPETFNKSVMKSKRQRYQVVATTHCDIVVLVILGCLVYHSGNWTNHSTATSWEWDTYDGNITNFIWDLGLSRNGGPQVERQVVFIFYNKKMINHIRDPGYPIFKRIHCVRLSSLCVCVALTRVSVTHNVLIKGNISYVYMSIYTCIYIYIHIYVYVYIYT